MCDTAVTAASAGVAEQSTGGQFTVNYSVEFYGTIVGNISGVTVLEIPHAMSYTGECATMNNHITPLRRCKRCGIEYPETLEFFHKGKGNRGGLRPYCKKCRSDQHAENPESTRQSSKRRYYSDPQRAYQESLERRRKNPEKWKEYQKKYSDTHKEQIREKNKRRYDLKKDHVSAITKNWVDRNLARHRATAKRWNQNNPDKARAAKQRRRARERNLPDTFTAQDWRRSVEYFHGRCAVCERQCKDLFGTRTIAADHWIPLTHPDCPGTVPENMIPLCHGEVDCNCSKGSKHPIEWLNGKFGKRKAAEILKRIEAYFEWVKREGAYDN
jgi:hypothetical protein